MRKTILSTSLLLLAHVAMACGSDPTLEVHVVTSLVPGAQFTSVEIERLSPTSPYDGAAVLERVHTQAAFGDDFANGHRVATFSDFEEGDQVVQVRLRRADGTLLIARRLRTVVTSSAIVRIHLTPDCVGVICPAPAGSPSLTECLGGRCVDERCAPPSAEFCPEIVFCNSAADCPAPVSACAAAACFEGVCQVAPEPGACEEAEYCDPASGCQAQSVPDAGTLDLGMPDAGVEDMGATDAGPVVPDGSTCGGLCSLIDEPCRTGVVDCSTGVAVCAPYALRPVGTSCPGGGFCNSVGECDTCRDGADCSVGCARGQVDCSWGYERCVLDEGLGNVEPGTSCAATHACVEGDTCDDTTVCLETGVCGACTVEGASCWSDPTELYQGCALGTRSCAAGGACVVSYTYPSGTACGLSWFNGDHNINEGFCDGAGVCVNCVHDEACETANGCGTGRRDCGTRCIEDDGSCDDHEGYAAGACVMDDPYAPGTSCASGVCDGNGLCIEPLEAKHLGRNASFFGGCVVTNDDGVKCWTRADGYAITLTDVPGFPSAVVQVSGNASYGCALTSDGDVWCWDASLVPAPKSLPDAATLVDVSATEGCAIVTGGQLYCWGRGPLIGTGDGVDQPEPVAIAGLDNIVDVRLGSTPVALRATGEILRWGTASSDMRGFGTSVIPTYIPLVGSFVLTPVTVDGIDDATKIAQGAPALAEAAVRADGSFWYWGAPLAAGAYPYGLPGSAEPAPVPIPFTDVVAVSFVYGGLCMLRGIGEQWCFGGWGALGRGGRGDFGEPASIAGVDNVVDVSGECGITSAGNVYCWEARGFDWWSEVTASVPAFLPSESRM